MTDLRIRLMVAAVPGWRIVWSDENFRWDTPIAAWVVVELADDRDGPYQEMRPVYVAEGTFMERLGEANMTWNEAYVVSILGPGEDVSADDLARHRQSLIDHPVKE